MNIKNTIVLIIVMLASLNCKSQEGQTYWEINNIYREDKTPFQGLTEDAMQKILDYNFHFIRKGDSLYFDLPKKFSIKLSTFKNLSQLQIKDRDYYQMYGHSLERDTFKVKFKDLATMTDSKNTVLEFTRISGSQYEDHLKEEIAERKTIAEKMNTLKLQLVSSPQILWSSTQKLPQKNLVIEDDKGKSITLLVPNEIDLKKSGQIKTQQFGVIKIGTFVKNAVVYDILHPKKDYGLKQLSIWMSTDPAAFNFDNWKRENPNRIIFKEDRDAVIGYELDYDTNKQKAIVQSFFCLKYKKVGQTHVFVYADVYKSQFAGNYDPLKEMNEILNFNYLMLDNIKIQ